MSEPHLEVSIISNARYCYACRQEVDAWAEGPGGRSNASCPRCQALERHRFLAYLLDRLEPVLIRSRMVLDIAPHPQIQALLERLVGHRYVAIDRSGHLPVDLVADLCDLPFDDDSVDLAICYHVLEHIPDDASAIRQLARVLDPSAIALVQVPQRAHAPTIEDPSAPVEIRVRKFGQADHVRYYGGDFEDRLSEHGLNSTRIDPTEVLAEHERGSLGIAPEPVWVCRPVGQRLGAALEEIMEETLADWSARPLLPPPRPKRRTGSLASRVRDWLRKVVR